MAVQTVYVCSEPFDSRGRCDFPMALDVDNDLATALITHSVALQNNTDAMTDFFTMEPADVSLISGILLVFFIVGNSTGRIAHLFRKG